MKGTISHIRKYRGGHYFIMGEDGVEYVTHRKETVNAKQNEIWFDGYWLSIYDVYAYDGNDVEFDISDKPQDGDRPRAINVVLSTEAPDPMLHDKLMSRKEAEEARERKEERRRKHENKANSKSAKEELQGYVVQQRVGEKWANVYKDGKLCWSKEITDAKRIIADMQEYGERYRLKRVQFLKNYVTGEMIARPIN